jgi:hypothetical protein
MSLDKYRQWKHKFENTTPIRGRAVECRPWGARRTDWEEIVKVLTPQGEGYGAKLYDTDCVVIAPNGDMYVKTGGWATPTTAEWINYRSGYRCYKKYNKVWIDVDGRSIPVSSTPLHLVWDEEKRKHTCDKKIVMQQQVVDKDKIKAVRHTLKDFKAFVKVMMTLSDGWVSRELLNLHRTYKNNDPYAYGGHSYILQGETFTSWDLRGGEMSKMSAERFLKCMQNCTEDTDKVKLMLMLTEGCNNDESRVISVEEVEREYNGQKYKSQYETREYKYKPSTIVNRIDYVIKKGADVYTMKEVEVTKPMTKLG